MSFYTKEFGSARAVARGVRLAKSKLRCLLDDFSFIRVGLVRGKDVWRIVDAEEIFSLSGIKKNCFKLRAISKIFVLLKRLTQGEEKNLPLWQVVSGGVNFLNQTGLTQEELKNFETVMVLRILNQLGHLGKEEKTEPFLRNEWSKEFLNKMAKSRIFSIFEIKKALEASHL